MSDDKALSPQNEVLSSDFVKAKEVVDPSLKKHVIGIAEKIIITLTFFLAAIIVAYILSALFQPSVAEEGRHVLQKMAEQSLTALLLLLGGASGYIFGKHSD